MKAAVMYRRNDPLNVEEVELSEPGLNEVSVRFAASGVCHSDLHHWRWEMGSPLPLILGHEGAGVVTKTGCRRDQDKARRSRDNRVRRQVRRVLLLSAWRAEPLRT